MSGDVQPRKRKDKRRKKEGESLGNIHDIPETKKSLNVEEEHEESPVRGVSDKGENIHVHHEHGIGGNACVKVIFFALLAVLLGLVGLIFIESRGSTDVDLPSIEDSRFSEYFTGWLDDAPDDHGHDDHAVASEEDDHDDGHDDHDEHDEEEAGHSDEQDDEGHSEAQESEDRHTEEEDDDDNGQDVTEESEEREPESAAPDDDEIENSEEEQEPSEEDEVIEDSDVVEESEEEIEESEEEDEEEDYDLTQEDGSEEGSIFEPKEITKKDDEDSGVVSAEYDGGDDEKEVDNESDDDGNDESEETVDNEVIEETTEIADEEEQKPTIVEESVEFVEEIEESEEALKEEEEAVKKEKLSLLEDDEDVESISDAKLRKKKERELMRKLEKLLKEQVKTEKEEGGDETDEETEETGGVALKLGVGVALVVVAHLVVVRRWRALTHAGEEARVDVTNTDDGETDGKQEAGEEPVVSRRQTLIPETADIPVENEEELDEEYDDGGYSEEEAAEQPIKRRTSVDVKKERQDTTKYYTNEELGDSEELDDEEELGEEEEEYEEEIEEEEEFELEGSETPSDLGDPEEDEEEEEDEPPPPPPPQRAANIPPRRGPQGVENDDTPDDGGDDDDDNDDDEFEKDSAEESKNSAEPKLQEEDDWLFRQELDFADEQFHNNPQSALEAYSAVLKRAPNSLRALIGRARTFDKLAELKRNNILLGQAVDAYETLLKDHSLRLNDTTYRQLAARCVDRMRFAGRNIQAASVHQLMTARFPTEVEHPNALAVSYLLAGRTSQAQKVLENTLKIWPDDGFAQVHLGFVLKTSGGLLAEGAKLLEQGLKSNQTGTFDGRFIFHLGDALHRLGRADEAISWYERGVLKGIFKSKYQRSLYNVDRLKAQPWWPIEETTYTDFFRGLERNWKQIREEGMTLLRSRDKSFQDEAESLRDTGDWKQLDLFSRGRKQPGCARAPITCQLIAAFAPSATCSRGQAKFSVMEPGTHVWPHCGPTNCRLRAHLGLVVPQGVYLRVAEQTKSWEEGKMFVFDDSFEHEVWHNGSSVRLVLIVDVWHPELTNRERQTLSPI